MQKKRTIEVVVQAELDGASMLFDALGNVHLAAEPEGLGRWVVELVEDDKIPDVAFGKPVGRWTEFASRVLGDLGGKSVATPDEATAVHFIVQVMVDDEHERFGAVVNPPKGRPRSARDVDSLGVLLDELARDDAQPKVPAGAPPESAVNLAEQAVSCLLQG